MIVQYTSKTESIGGYSKRQDSGISMFFRSVYQDYEKRKCYSKHKQTQTAFQNMLPWCWTRFLPVCHLRDYEVLSISMI